MIRYGKPVGPLFDHKKSFFLENDEKLAEFKRIARVYTEQPRRNECKNCNNLLDGVTFEKMGIEYAFCSNCSHLNGAHQDTDIFCASIYTDDDGEAYAASYKSEDINAFNKRVNDIYLPKASFMVDVLKDRGEIPEALEYADFGAGSGYFIAACMQRNLKHVKGYEVSKKQVELANHLLNGDFLILHSLNQTIALAESVQADVVSLIGVLEHVQKPRGLLKALSNNHSVKYLFLSLPLFSPCVFFETAFPEVRPRHLVGGHTHLYTEASIDYFCREYKFQRIGEWWFGTDLMDLYRSVYVSLEKSSRNKGFLKSWEDFFKPVIDDMQLIFDKRKMSSEVHLMLESKS